MRAFTAIAALFAAGAAAAPAAAASHPKEDVWVSDLVVRKWSGIGGTSIQAVSFDIQTADLKTHHCEATTPDFPSAPIQCKNGAPYFFQLLPGTEKDVDFDLKFSHHYSDGGRVRGQGGVPTTCRAGGNGPTDYVCTQSTPVGIWIK